jgi:hypothetical protein
MDFHEVRALICIGDIGLNKGVENVKPRNKVRIVLAVEVVVDH